LPVQLNSQDLAGGFDVAIMDLHIFAHALCRKCLLMFATLASIPTAFEARIDADVRVEGVVGGIDVSNKSRSRRPRAS
jgi:hypothetical protein